MIYYRLYCFGNGRCIIIIIIIKDVVLGAQDSVEWGEDGVQIHWN